MKTLLRVERHVELALAALEERYRLPEAVLLEVLGVAVRLVAVLIDVLLVEEEQIRVLRITVSLIKQVARLITRERRELPYRLLDFVRLALSGRPLRHDNECHISMLLSFRSCFSERQCPLSQARRRLPRSGSGPSRCLRRLRQSPSRKPHRGRSSALGRRRRSCPRTCGACWTSCPRPTSRR